MFNEKVNTARVNNVTTVGPKAVVSAAVGNGENVVKSSACWIWRPTGNVIDHTSKDKGLIQKLDDLKVNHKFRGGLLGIKGFYKFLLLVQLSTAKRRLSTAKLSIASLLLPSGRTIHSRFKLPLKLTEESLCRITKNTQLGKLLADTDLIIWDEAPMNDHRCFEALDRSLRDIVDKPSSLFGGKSVLLGGDFRQTLPVKKGASKIEVISSCISESALWPSFKVFTLKHNMRLARPDISLEERSLVNSFASWLLDVGDGKIGEPADEDPENTSWVHIPPAYCLPPDE
ncbi:DNA helicase [Tanacetum coccineum]